MMASGQMDSGQPPTAAASNGAHLSQFSGDNSSLERGDILEKGPSPITSAKTRLATRMHTLCAKNSGRIMVGLIILLVLALIAAMLSIFLTGGGSWAKYKAWERQHAYDAPVSELLPLNFPDPAVLFDKGKKTFYLFATNNAAGILFRPHNNASDLGYGTANVQLATWAPPYNQITLLEPQRQPLPRVGAWANSGMTKASIAAPALPRAEGWSPGVIRRRTDKRYVMYYSAATTAPGSNATTGHRRRRWGHCIGAAVSRGKSPLGPYLPLPDTLVCDLERGGAIDPSPFMDKHGVLYLAYSESPTVRHA